MLKRLLVPLDGSSLAESALPSAERLARRTGAEILLVRVVPPPPQSAFAPAPRLPEAEEEAAREYLTRVAGRPTFRGLQVAVRAVRGYPAMQIAEFARRRVGTLVIMASHGLTGLRRTGVGSVADKVVHLVRAPVLLIPALTVRPPEPVRLLVGLDGSPRAEAVLPVAADLARGLDLPVVLGHVLPPDAPEGAREAAGSYLRQVRDRLAASGLAVTVEVYEGRPADALVAGGGRDVVALASHGRTGLGRWLLGSVAERVVDQAAGPVLLVRAPVERRRAEDAERHRREIAL